MSDLAPMVRLDLLTLIASRRMLLVYVMLVCFFSFMGGWSFALPMIGVAGVVTCLNLFSIAEANNLRRLYGALPVRRRTVMTSHYLVTAGLTVVAIGVGLLVTAIAALMRGESLVELGVSGAATLGALLLVLAFLVLAYVKWGTTMGAWLGLILVLVVSGGILLSGDVIGPLLVDALGPTLVGLGSAVGWLLLALAVVAQVASWWVAVRIYERQDH